MTTTTTNGIANTMTSPASNDLLDIWNVAAGRLDKITRANLVGATITGGGTIALGGFTLTIPATGTAALRGAVNTFTTTQAISPSATNLGGLVVDMPTSTTSYPFIARYNTVDRQYVNVNATVSQYVLLSADLGANGPHIVIGRNQSGTTPSAGFINITSRPNTGYNIWPDGSGDLRIATVIPTQANDAAGTVVGAQTSMAAAKHIGDQLSHMDDVAARIRQGAAAVKRFTYKSGSFGGQEFEGVVIDDAPEYGMDRDKEHPAGKSLNEINIAGDLLRFAAWAMQRIEHLEARLQ